MLFFSVALVGAHAHLDRSVLAQKYLLVMGFFAAELVG
jgi:hypothetical protein